MRRFGQNFARLHHQASRAIRNGISYGQGWYFSTASGSAKSAETGVSIVRACVTLDDSGIKGLIIRLEKNMNPPSEATKLESKGRFVEYVGSGKLKDKKVLITGGEYVHHL
jgi:hypothetical protein